MYCVACSVYDVNVYTFIGELLVSDDVGLQFTRLTATRHGATQHAASANKSSQLASALTSLFFLPPWVGLLIVVAARVLGNLRICVICKTLVVSFRVLINICSVRIEK